MYCRCKWIEWMKNQRNACGKKFSPLNIELLLHHLRHFTFHLACIDTCFFKDSAILKYTGTTTTSAGTFPSILTETFFSIQFRQSVADPILQTFDMSSEPL